MQVLGRQAGQLQAVEVPVFGAVAWAAPIQALDAPAAHRPALAPVLSAQGESGL